MLQRRSARLHTSVQELATEFVSEVYTYGAPATHKTPLINKASADGCFAGLRCYTEDIIGVHGESKQVDAAAIFNRYPHMRTNTVVLRWKQESLYAPCNGSLGLDGHPEWPQKGVGIFSEWRLHQEDDYTDRLQTVMIDGQTVADQAPFNVSAQFAHLAWRTYETLREAKAKARKMISGWRLVAYFQDVHGSDRDPVGLMQDESTLDCAVLFTGTNDFAEMFTSTVSFGTGFCGFSDIHVGYRNELWTLTGEYWEKHMKPRLSKCRRVSCVGHSLGGALCEVFAACANSGHTADEDFKRLIWEQGTPELMEIDFSDRKSVV